MRVDLKTRLQFPREITQTTLRPDIVIWSTASKQVLLIELTVPWEERIELAYERKRTKYDDFQCEQAGWSTWCAPIEVGKRICWQISLENEQIAGNKGNGEKEAE